MHADIPTGCRAARPSLSPPATPAVILAIGAGVAGVFYWRKRRHLASGANPLSTNRFERCVWVACWPASPASQARPGQAATCQAGAEGILPLHLMHSPALPQV